LGLVFPTHSICIHVSKKQGEQIKFDQNFITFLLAYFRSNSVGHHITEILLQGRPE
jgi:hypothetical protein